MKFFIKDFFSTFTEEILNGKLHFFVCSDSLVEQGLQKPLLGWTLIIIST